MLFSFPTRRHELKAIDTTMSSAVISEPVITIFQLSDYAKGLVGVDKQTYLDFFHIF